MNSEANLFDERKRDGIQKYLEQYFPDDIEDILLADGLEEAFIGVSRSFAGAHVAVYDIDIIMQVLVKQGMTLEEAHEYFEFNTLGSYMGPHTPIYLTRYDSWAHEEHPLFDASLWTTKKSDFLFGFKQRDDDSEEDTDGRLPQV